MRSPNFDMSLAHETTAQASHHRRRLSEMLSIICIKIYDRD
jgi:hypothetical protein